MMFGYNERPLEGLETTVKLSTGLCVHCGGAFSTQSYVHISDADQEHFTLLSAAAEEGDLSKLNSLTCPHCDATLSGVQPFSVHLTEQRRLLIVVPASQALWSLEAQAGSLAALAARDHITPQEYFTRPELCVGAAQLTRALSGAPLPEQRLSAEYTSKKLATGPLKATSPKPPSPQAPALSALAPLTGKTGASTHTSPEASVDALDALIDAALDQEPTGIYEMNEGTPAPVQLSQQLNALDPMNPATLPPSLPALETAAQERALSPTAISLLEAAGGASEVASPSAAGEHTRVDFEIPSESGGMLQEEQATQITPVPAPSKLPVSAPKTSAERVAPPPPKPPALSANEAPSTQLLYSSSMNRFDHEAAGHSNTYLTLTDEGGVEASALLDERQAEGWLMCDLEVRAQLHIVDGGAAPCLTLFSVQEGALEDELYWPIKVDGPLGPKLLRSLRRGFSFELKLYKKNGHHYGTRTVTAPLEENVGYILSAIKRLLMTPKQAAAALVKVSAEDFDREGRMKHSFTQESFSELGSASEAKLALGIWGYWSTVKQRDYLLFVKSFPLPWLRRIQHRVLKAGLDFGLAMPTHLQSQAVALRLAQSEVELLQRTVANFTEVSLKLKPSQLSPLEEWENWDALLAQVDELGITIDEDIELLALQAMERAGLSGDDIFEPEPEPAPTALDNSAALEVVELDALESVDIEESEATGVSDVRELSQAESVEWVDDELIEEELIEDELLSAEMIESEELDEDLILSEELIEEELIEEELSGAEVIELEELEELDLSSDTSSDGES